MDVDMYRCGANIDSFLRKKGLKQKELANALEGNETMVSKWVRGESLPSTRSILKMSYIFGVSLDELMEGVLIP